MMSVAAPASASPAYYYAGGVGTTQFGVGIDDNMNGTWSNFLRSGFAAWNNTYTTTHVAIGEVLVGPADKNVILGTLPSGTLGLYAPAGTRANRAFLITLDANQIINAPGRIASIGSWATFATIHELGHSLSIIDNPNTSSTSVMKYHATSWSSPYQSPQTWDKNAVATIYG